MDLFIFSDNKHSTEINVLNSCLEDSNICRHNLHNICYVQAPYGGPHQWWNESVIHFTITPLIFCDSDDNKSKYSVFHHYLIFTIESVDRLSERLFGSRVFNFISYTKQIWNE